MPRKFNFSVPRLIDAWRAARLADQHGRDTRREMVRQYIGPHWSGEGVDTDLPVNLIALYVAIQSRSLIAKTPRFALSSFDRSQAAAIDAVQSWGNLELESMKFAVTQRRIVIDGLFGGGFGRVALARPSDSAARGWGPKAGEPIFSRIDREDFAYDTFAGDFNECAWLMHKYRVPLATVREDKTFTRFRKDLSPSRAQPYDELGSEKIGVLSRSYYGEDELEDMVELGEFYLPRHKAIITLYFDEGGSPCLCADQKPLGEQAWVGPDNGPYYPLGFNWVPGNAMPKGPIQDLIDLHLAANQFYRKVIGETERMKAVTLFQNEEDARRIQKLNSGDMGYCERPTDVNTVVFGGEVVQPVLGVAMQMKMLFDMVGGNLSVLGGLGQQASTATQEKILNENAGGSVADMADTTVRYSADVIGGMCWYWWKHPFKVMEAPAEVEGLQGIQSVRRVYPRNAMNRMGQPMPMRRQLPFDKLGIKVDPYSLAPSTPQQKLAILRDVMKGEVLPLLPLLQQQNIAPDMHAYLRKIGRYADDPDIQEILTIRESPVAPSGRTSTGGQGQPTMPGQTERNYNRTSTSEKTGDGQDQSMVTQMLSGKSQGGSPKSYAGMGA